MTTFSSYWWVILKLNSPYINLRPFYAHVRPNASSTLNDACTEQRRWLFTAINIQIIQMSLEYMFSESHLTLNPLSIDGFFSNSNDPKKKTQRTCIIVSVDEDSLARREKNGDLEDFCLTTGQNRMNQWHWCFWWYGKRSSAIRVMH